MKPVNPIKPVKPVEPVKSLKISATSHGHNYLPEYFAAATGGFARRGLAVDVWDRDPWDGVLADLVSKEADVVLGGLWVPAMYAGRGPDLVAVGQLNARFSKVLVTREKVDDFDWSWISGRTVLVPGAGGTAPYEFTAGLIRDSGVDPGSARFVRDLSGRMLCELFAGGHGDAIVLDTFNAVRFTRLGHGHQTFAMAGPGGEMPNSVYYTLRDRLDELHEPLVALLGGVQEAMDAIVSGADTGEILAAHWPGVPEPVLAEATDELIKNGTWEGVTIGRAACDRWIDVLRTAGLVSTDVAFDTLVDTRAVEAMTAGEGAGERP